MSAGREWPGIEVVGHNLVYRGLVSISWENVMDMMAYGMSEEMLYEHMKKAYEGAVSVRRDRRIREALGQERGESDGD